MATRQLQHIADITAEPAYLQRDPATVAIAEKAGARSMLLVPMLKESELIGAIVIYRQEVRPFTEKQIELLTSFAAQETVAFEGIEARAVDVQVQVAPGVPAFNVVGLPDKAVSEARERVRSALVASGLALPARRITVNMAPADLPKEGYQNGEISRACSVPLRSVVPLDSNDYF